MHPSRRRFLQTSLAAGSALAVTPLDALARLPRRGAPLKILVLGGTSFIGPAFIEAAHARGHTLTLFNRGRIEQRRKVTGRDSVVPDDVEVLYGNRDPKLTADDWKDEARDGPKDPNAPRGLTQLEGRTWDAALDTSGFYPRIVKASAELLAPSVKHYTFISSVSVYADNSKPGGNTSDPVGRIADPTVETMGANFENYGPLKALCEEAAEAAMPGRVANVRPGLIVGPGDGTDRFTYWPHRFSRAVGDRAEVLCPGDPADPIQIIDVRDLAEWLVVLIEGNVTGAFDAIGPQTGLTIGSMLEACRAASTNDARMTWVNAEFLEEHKVSPWGDMPVWVPPKGDSVGFHQRDVSKSIAAGLKFRPIEVTARDTQAWIVPEIEQRVRTAREVAEKAKAEGKTPPQSPDPTVLRAGISDAREAEVLAAWHARGG